MKNKDQIVLENLYSGIFRKGRCLHCGSLLTTEEVSESKKEKNIELMCEGKSDCNGVVLYHGVSNGENVVCIATGIAEPSSNEKTGPMVQIWILNSDVSPIEAIKSGKDVGVCFNCIHRGGTCYVNAAQGPNSIYNSYKNGNYPSICKEGTDFTTGNVADIYLKNGYWNLFQSSHVRFGAYGDPVVIPLPIIEKITSICKGWTGYTHQWKDTKYSAYSKYLMASVDMPNQYAQAKSLGWRSFRVTYDWFVKAPTEQACLNSRDGTQCIDCLQCCGTSKNDKDIYIKVHGLKHKVSKFIEKFGKGDFAEPLTNEEKIEIENIEKREAASKDKNKKEVKKLSPLEKLMKQKGITND